MATMTAVHSIDSGPKNRHQYTIILVIRIPKKGPLLLETKHRGATVIVTPCRELEAWSLYRESRGLRRVVIWLGWLYAGLI